MLRITYQHQYSFTLEQDLNKDKEGKDKIDNLENTENQFSEYYKMAPKKFNLQIDQNSSSEYEEQQVFLPTGSLEFPNIENQNLYSSFQEGSEEEDLYEQERQQDELGDNWSQESQSKSQSSEHMIKLDNIIEYEEIELGGKSSPLITNKFKSNGQIGKQEQNSQQPEKQVSRSLQFQNDLNVSDEVQEGIGINIAEAESLNAPYFSANSQVASQFTKAVPVPPTSKLKGKKFEFPSFGGLSEKASTFSNVLNNKKENKIQLQIHARSQVEQVNQQQQKEDQEQKLPEEDSQNSQSNTSQLEQLSGSKEQLSQDVQQQQEEQQDQQQNMTYNKTEQQKLPAIITYTQETLDQLDSNKQIINSSEKKNDFVVQTEGRKKQNPKLRQSLEDFGQKKKIYSQNVQEVKENTQLEEYKCQTRRLLAMVTQKEQKLNLVKTQQKLGAKELKNLQFDMMIVKEAIEEIVPLNALQASVSPKSIKNEIAQKIYTGVVILRNIQCQNNSKMNKLEKENRQLMVELQGANEINNKQNSEHLEIIVSMNEQLKIKEQEIEILQAKLRKLTSLISFCVKNEELNNTKSSTQTQVNSNHQKYNHFNQTQNISPALKQINEINRTNKQFESLQQESQSNQLTRSKFLRDLEQKSLNITSALQNLQTTKYKDGSQTLQLQDITPNTTKARRIVSVSPGSIRKPSSKLQEQHRRQISTDMNQEIMKSINPILEEEAQAVEAKKLYPHTFRLSPKLAKELVFEDMKRKYSPL